MEKFALYDYYLVSSRTRLVGGAWRRFRVVRALNRLHAIDLVYSRRTPTGRMAKHRPSFYPDNRSKDGTEDKPLIVSYSTEVMAQIATEDERHEPWLNPVYRDERGIIQQHERGCP